MTAPETSLVLGHDLAAVDMHATGFDAWCECGESFFGVFRYKAVDAWMAHQDEELENGRGRVEAPS